MAACVAALEKRDDTMYENNGLDPMFQEEAGGMWNVTGETLSGYTAKTFGWMGLGLLCTFAIAFASYFTGLVWYSLVRFPYLPFVLAIAEIVVVMVLSARLAHLSAGAATGLFFAYSALNGLTFASLFLLYDVTTLVYVFGMTAVYFGALAAYGWFTKRDLSNLRSILFAGLMFLLLYWVVSIFLPMGMFEKFICFVGLAVFLGYTAYDTQKIKRFYDAYRFNPEMAHKGAIFCALQLYLDFVNIFLYLLRLLGRRSSN